MRLFISALLMFSASWASAQDLQVQTCEEAGVDLTSLILPAAKNSRTFYKNDVGLFGIDQIEPVCCAVGVAITMPDPESEMGGIKKCFAILGYSGVDVSAAQAEYDERRGLDIRIPVRGYDPNRGDYGPQSPIRLRLNLKKGSISVLK